MVDGVREKFRNDTSQILQAPQGPYKELNEIPQKWYKSMQNRLRTKW